MAKKDWRKNKVVKRIYELREEFHLDIYLPDALHLEKLK